MEIITKEKADSLTYKADIRGKGKSELRKNLEALESGQVAMFRNHGHDYSKYSQLYNAVGAIRKATGREFTLRQLANKEGAVVERTA